METLFGGERPNTGHTSMKLLGLGVSKLCLRSARSGSQQISILEVLVNSGVKAGDSITYFLLQQVMGKGSLEKSLPSFGLLLPKLLPRAMILSRVRKAAGTTKLLPHPVQVLMTLLKPSVISL